MRSKAQRVYRSVVDKATGSDSSKQVEQPEARTPPPPQISKSTTARPSRPGVLSYSDADHKAIIEYYASDPVGSKAQIWEAFHQMVLLLFPFTFVLRSDICSYLSIHIASPPKRCRLERARASLRRISHGASKAPKGRLALRIVSSILRPP